VGDSLPVDIFLEAVKAESRRMKERWSWTTRDIVAKECEGVANERQQDREGRDDDSRILLMIVYKAAHLVTLAGTLSVLLYDRVSQYSRSGESKRTVHQTRSHAVLAQLL